MFLHWSKFISQFLNQYILTKIINIVLIFIISFLITKLGKKIISKYFKSENQNKYPFDSKRLVTMGTVLSSVFTYSVYVIAIVTALTDNPSTILAAAGIGGVAFGLGAQSIIRDVLTGIFILIDKQFSVGEIVTIEGLKGIVEGIELRLVRIKDANGDLYIIPNSEIKKVINHSRGIKCAMIDVPVSYNADIDVVYEVAGKVCESIKIDYSDMIETSEVAGVNSFDKECMFLRLIVKVHQIKQVEVEREIRRRIKREFERNDILFR